MQGTLKIRSAKQNRTVMFLNRINNDKRRKLTCVAYSVAVTVRISYKQHLLCIIVAGLCAEEDVTNDLRANSSLLHSRSILAELHACAPVFAQCMVVWASIIGVQNVSPP